MLSRHGPGREGESKTDWSNSAPDPRGKALIWSMQIESHQPHLLLTLASHSDCHQHSLLNSHTRASRILSHMSHMAERWAGSEQTVSSSHKRSIASHISLGTSVSHISWQEIVKQEVCQLTASQSFIMPFKIVPFADTQTLSTYSVINRFVSPLSAAQSGGFPLPSTRQPSQLRLSHHF